MLMFIAVAIFGIVLLTVSVVFDDLLGEFLDLPFLSGTAVGGFCAAFGFTGVLGLSATGSFGVAVGAGIAAGLVVGAVASGVTRYLSADDGTEIPSMDSVLGRRGIVTADITEGSFGAVSVKVGSHVTRYSARSAVPLTVGTPVEVEFALTSTAVMVRPLAD